MVDTRINSSPNALQAIRESITDPFFGSQPHFSGNCLPERPGSVVARRTGRRVRLTWRAVPNATSYEVWRGSRRVATTTSTRWTGVRGSYRVRGVNPLGVGPFALVRG